MKSKKRIFMGLAGLVMMAAAAIVTVSSVNANSSDSDLLTKNLEALTRSEGDGNYNYGKHPCPGWWFFNGSEDCCIMNGEGNNCNNPGGCTGTC